MKVIKVKKADQRLFPVNIGNKRVELIKDADGNMILSEATLNWNAFQNLHKSAFWARAKKQQKFKHKPRAFSLHGHK